MLSERKQLNSVCVYMYYVCFSLLFDARVAWRAYEWVKVWEINLTSSLRLLPTPGLCAVSSHPGDGTDGTDINGLFTLRGPYLIQMLSNCLHALAIDWRALLPSHTGKGERMRLSKKGCLFGDLFKKTKLFAVLSGWTGIPGEQPVPGKLGCTKDGFN